MKTFGKSGELEEAAVERGISRVATWRWAVVLSLFSGAAALGHQLLWTRRMIDLLGAGAESSSRVFGVFFLGLALGGAAAFVMLNRIRSPWRWLAGAEIGILLLALPIYFLPWWSDAIWPLMGPERLTGWEGGWLKLGLSVLILLPPAFLMGWFLPILASAVLGGDRQLRRHGVRLYGWNTLGGVIGLSLTAAVFLPLFGAAGAFAAVLVFNAVTATGCLWLDRRAPRPSASPERRPVIASSRSLPGWGVGVLAFVSGFGVLALEVALLETLMLVAPLSFYAPAAVLACVILLLALAAFLAGPAQRVASIPLLMAGSLGATALVAAATPVVFFLVSQISGGLPPAANFTLFLGRLLLFSFLVCGPVFFMAGLTFPLLTAWSDRAGSDPGGRNWGLLLAVNGIGGLCGAELAYRWLLPQFGLYGAIWSVGLVYGVCALAAGTLLRADEARMFSGRMIAICSCVVVLLLARPVQNLTTINPFMRIDLVEEWSGREGTVAVVEREDFGRGLLVYNQYMLGTTGARHDQARQAHLPLMLHPAPERVAFIGLATGITPGAALLHAGVEEVVSIELSHTVTEAARAYFGEHQNGLFTDPRSRVAIADGRTYIASAPESFDVVAGDLFLPWGPGEARLYSREHFGAVKRSLRPGGLFCQWLPLYQLTAEDLQVIVATFRMVFPEVHLFVNGFRPDTAALAMVGFQEGGRINWEQVERRTAGERDHGGVSDPLMRWVEGVEMLYLGSVKEPSVGSVHTLNNLLIELRAGRERVTGRPEEKYLTGERWHTLSREMRENAIARNEASPERLREADRLAGLELQLRRGEIDRAEHRRQLHDTLPPRLLRDPGADPTAWPGSYFPGASQSRPVFPPGEQGSVPAEARVEPPPPGLR